METTFTQILAGFGGLIWMTTLFPLYTLYILWRNNWKVLHSISDSWYILKQKEQHEEILFTIFTYFLGIGLILQYYHSFLFFIGGMGLFWVGTQTQFRGESIKGTIHYIGAVLGIFLSLFGLLLNGVWLPPLIMFIGLVGIRYFKIPNFIWWVEILAFITIIWGLWSL
jgi:hypothetical protein